MMTVLFVANKKKWRDARCEIDGQVVVWKCVVVKSLCHAAAGMSWTTFHEASHSLTSVH
jgi:hypothetical protein